MMIGLVLNWAVKPVCRFVFLPAFGFKGVPDDWCPSAAVFLALALDGVALTTFFRFLADSGADNPENMRTSITITLVTVYVILVCLVAFYGPVGKEEQLHPLTQAVVTSFTAIIGNSYTFLLWGFSLRTGKRGAYTSRRGRQAERRTPEGKRRTPREARRPYTVSRSFTRSVES